MRGIAAIAAFILLSGIDGCDEEETTISKIDCPGETQKLLDLSNDFQESLDQSCSQNEDCTSILNSFSCHNGCFIPMHVDNVDTFNFFKNHNDEVDQICDLKEEANCPITLPNCAQLQPACVGGLCRLVNSF